MPPITNMDKPLSQWELLLDMSDGVVPVRSRDGALKLAHVDGDYFSLVANDISYYDTAPSLNSYNVLPAWAWSLFREPASDYARPVAGKIRDPTVDCCPVLSWSKVLPEQIADTLQLAIKAARLTIHDGAGADATKAARTFLERCGFTAHP